LVLNRTYDNQDCSIARSLEILGERWTLLIIRDVFNGRRRFDQLQDGLGVARNVLANRLSLLMDEGILEKRAYQQRPTRFEYRLTEKGIDLWPVLMAMLEWGDRYVSGSDGPPMIVRHKSCDGIVDGRGVCGDCGQRLDARDAYAVRTPAPQPTTA
jgi:DNA-binding HxlR family transcriptional regulator